MGALGVLVCDVCLHFFRAGKRSEEPLRPDDFAQVADAAGDVEILLAAARDAGWQSASSSGRVRWKCADCIARNRS
jgi:hypothetical protein